MMKKFLFVAFTLLLGSALAWAFEPVWKASHTATADTTQPLCLSQTFYIGTSTSIVGGHGIIHSVCTNDDPANSGFTAIYNSSNTAINPIAVIRSTAAINMGCLTYDVIASSGLTYTNSAANDITILYSCY